MRDKDHEYTVRLVNFTETDRATLEDYATRVGLSLGRYASWLLHRELRIADPLDAADPLIPNDHMRDGVYAGDPEDIE